MPTPSNLYAEKIFSEHPIALWSLDEILSGSTTSVSNIKNVNTFDGYVANAYGLNSKNGWYVKDLVLNDGIPLVYGAPNVTRLLPSVTDGQPSLLIPGYGFLNKIGRYQDITLEFWLRISSQITSSLRLVGPVASDDGLYINESSLTLKIGSNIKSHFVGEWGRPMLVQIHAGKNGANLIINGEQIFYMEYTYNPQFPDQYDLLTEQDWIAFTPNYPSQMDVDCIAIYPYAVTPVMAKRRFVYGQGVINPSKLNAAYNGTDTLIDYSFANYAKNYSIPGTEKWINGTYENVLPNGDLLTTPTYSLPTIKSFKNNVEVSTADFLQDILANQDSGPSFISFKPNNDYTNGYIKFDSLSILQNQLKVLYGIFLLTDNTLDTPPQILFRIQNKFTNDYIQADAYLTDVHKAKVSIRYSIAGTDLLLQEYTDINTNTNDFAIGIDIDKFSNNSDQNVANFFSNLDHLSLYVGGLENYSPLFDGFKGKIYKFALGDEYSYNKIKSQDFPPENGTHGNIFSINTGLINFTSSYTLISKQVANTIVPDIAIDGYWQNSIPLSYLAKKNSSQNYKIDLLQFNIDYPAILNMGYTSNNIKSFISFQTIASGAFGNPIEYVNSFDGSYIVDTYSDANWATSKYEVLDGTNIYKPSLPNLEELAIVVRIEFNVQGIISNPINIRNLQIASLINEDLIGSRFGSQISQYLSSDAEDAKNSFAIYKGSTPYLYQNNNTGLKILGDQAINSTSQNSKKGLDINFGNSDSKISSIQMFLKDRLFTSEISTDRKLIFEIHSKSDGILKFYLTENVDELSASISCYDESDTAYTKVKYSVNGSLLGDSASFNPKQWNSLGIEFPQLILTDSKSAIRLVGPMIFNNISYYTVGNNAYIQKTSIGTWDYTKTNNATWNAVKTNDATWNSAYLLSVSDIKSIDPQKIYQIYTGTNKIIIGDSSEYSDSTKIGLGGYQYLIYSNKTSQSIIAKPV